MKIDLCSICDIVNEVSEKNLPVYVCNQGLANEYTASNKRLLNEIGTDFIMTDKKLAITKLYDWYRMNEAKINVSQLIYGK